MGARGQGAPGQMTWLKGFSDNENVKSITSLDRPTSGYMSYSFITVSVRKIVIRLLTDVICMFAFKFLARVTF